MWGRPSWSLDYTKCLFPYKPFICFNYTSWYSLFLGFVCVNRLYLFPLWQAGTCVLKITFFRQQTIFYNRGLVTEFLLHLTLGPLELNWTFEVCLEIRPVVPKLVLVSYANLWIQFVSCSYKAASCTWAD